MQSIHLIEARRRTSRSRTGRTREKSATANKFKTKWVGGAELRNNGWWHDAYCRKARKKRKIAWRKVHEQQFFLRCKCTVLETKRVHRRCETQVHCTFTGPPQMRNEAMYIVFPKGIHCRTRSLKHGKSTCARRCKNKTQKRKEDAMQVKATAHNLSLT